MSDFSENLRLLCSQHRSVSDVCRDIGINRQQFGKYISGAGMPSAHNLRRICSYFAVDESELFEPHGSFRETHLPQYGNSGNLPWRALLQAFPGDRAAIRRYLGLYHSHFITPSWTGGIVRGLVQLYERDGYIYSRNVERAVDPETGIRMRLKFDGLASFLSEQLFIVEREANTPYGIAETILFPARQHKQMTYLRGLTFGISWRPRRSPYASRIIWKRLKEGTDPREAIKACSFMRFEKDRIDPVVQSYLEGRDSYPTSEELRREDFFSF